MQPISVVFTRGIPEASAYFHLYLVGQNSVVWPAVVTKETEKASI